jgi:hypothetical protein
MKRIVLHANDPSVEVAEDLLAPTTKWEDPEWKGTLIKTTVNYQRYGSIVYLPVYEQQQSPEYTRMIEQGIDHSRETVLNMAYGKLYALFLEYLPDLLYGDSYRTKDYVEKMKQFFEGESHENSTQNQQV